MEKRKTPLQEAIEEISRLIVSPGKTDKDFHQNNAYNSAILIIIDKLQKEKEELKNAFNTGGNRMGQALIKEREKTDWRIDESEIFFSKRFTSTYKTD